jgi:hypothetical protein
MTKPDQPNPVALPLLLVYGKPTSPDLPQASWFRGEDSQAVRSAAQTLTFSVIDIATEADRALLVGVHEGVLKGNSRMIVGSVPVQVYQRIEEQVRQKAGVSPAPTSEQTTNINDKGPATPSIKEAALTSTDGKVVAITSASSGSSKPEPPPARDPWDRLHIGSNVLGKYWGDDGEPIGWWVGVITAIDKNDFMIRWPDEANKRPRKIARRHVAIPHPLVRRSARVGPEAVKRRDGQLSRSANWGGLRAAPCRCARSPAASERHPFSRNRKD